MIARYFGKCKGCGVSSSHLVPAKGTPEYLEEEWLYCPHCCSKGKAVYFVENGIKCITLSLIAVFIVVMLLSYLVFR